MRTTAAKDDYEQFASSVKQFLTNLSQGAGERAEAAKEVVNETAGYTDVILQDFHKNGYFKPDAALGLLYCASTWGKGVSFRVQKDLKAKYEGRNNKTCLPGSRTPQS